MSTPTQTADLTLTVTGTWTDPNYVPPRCRKPRDRAMDATMQVSIPRLSSQDAPLAFVMPQGVLAPEPEEGMRHMRAYNGYLYAPVIDQPIDPTTSRRGAPEYVTAEQEWPDATWDATSYTRATRSVSERAASRQEWEQAVRAQTDTLVIIDGTVWRRSSEPGYYVTTFGMGRNHGGTALFASTDLNKVMFRADEYDKAVACAIDVAERRGDTRDVAAFQRPDDAKGERERIRVVDPDQVRLIMPPRESEAIFDLRRDYERAMRDYTDSITHAHLDKDAEQRAWEHLTGLRDRLLTEAPDVSGHAHQATPYRPLMP